MEYRIKHQRTIARCLECGDKISYGRTDKKYCCEDCRNRHHNHLLRAGRSVRRRVMAALEKNYTILNSFLESGVESVPLSEALSVGFNPNFMTSFAKKRGHEECGCFDISYRMTPSRLCYLSKLQNVSVSLQNVKNEKQLDLI